MVYIEVLVSKWLSRRNCCVLDSVVMNLQFSWNSMCSLTRLGIKVFK